LKFDRYTKLVFFTLIYIIFVILWGAFVRASGSGAGCGEHWPLCNGQILPRSAGLETLVEFGHRVTSGLSLLLVFAVTYFGLKRFSDKQHPGRKFVWASLIFILGEAAVGALLVLQRLVAGNDSLARAVVIAFHLVNTYFLLAAIAGVLWFSIFRQLKFWNLSAAHKLFFRVFAILLLFIGASGAIVALGDTLFPAQSLAHGFSQDFDSSSHFLLRLRAVHPILATIVAIGFVVSIPIVFSEKNASPLSLRISRILSFVVVAQIALGVLNLVLLAPTAMQLLHLFFADVVWVTFFFLWCSCAALKTESKI